MVDCRYGTRFEAAEILGQFFESGLFGGGFLPRFGTDGFAVLGYQFSVLFVGLAAKEDGSGKAFYLAGVLHAHGVAFGQAVGQCFVVFSRRFAAAMELIRCAVFNQPVLQFFKAALTVFKTSFKKNAG